jgi:cytochrome c oxidase cbb3-type subunit III
MSDAMRDNGKTPPPSGVEDRVMEHEYDGIREYDNPMPRWWLLTFAGTVIFSVVYMFNVGPVGNGKGRVADYEAEVAEQQRLHPVAASTVTEEGLLALGGDHETLEEGQEVYRTSCAACHGPAGGGLIGPNLTDEYWIHGARLSDIHKTVVDGVLAKGMPPWSKMLKPEQITAVVVYVASLKGSNPPGAKPPQGEIAKP